MAPSFAALGNQLFVAWTGIDDHKINIAQLGISIAPRVRLPLQITGDVSGTATDDTFIIERSAANADIIEVKVNGDIRIFRLS